MFKMRSFIPQGTDFHPIYFLKFSGVNTLDPILRCCIYELRYKCSECNLIFEVAAVEFVILAAGGSDTVSYAEVQPELYLMYTGHYSRNVAFVINSLTTNATAAAVVNRCLVN